MEVLLGYFYWICSNYHYFQLNFSNSSNENKTILFGKEYAKI